MSSVHTLDMEVMFYGDNNYGDDGRSHHNSRSYSFSLSRQVGAQKSPKSFYIQVYSQKVKST